MYDQTQFPVLKFIKLDLQCYNLEKWFLILAEHTSVLSCRGVWLQLAQASVYTSHRITCNFRQAELEDCCYSCISGRVNSSKFKPTSNIYLHCGLQCRHPKIAVRLAPNFGYVSRVGSFPCSRTLSMVLDHQRQVVAGVFRSYLDPQWNGAFISVVTSRWTQLLSRPFWGIIGIAWCLTGRGIWLHYWQWTSCTRTSNLQICPLKYAFGLSKK